MASSDIGSLPSLAASAPGGRDGLLEVDQLGVETIELVALAGDLCPLLG